MLAMLLMLLAVAGIPAAMDKTPERRAPFRGGSRTDAGFSPC
jgi:hypothetical protein